MSFKIPDGWINPSKIEPKASFDGVEQNLEKIPDGSISLEFYKKTEIRANTPGHNILLDKYDNETIIHVTQHYLNNCSFKEEHTYDGALQSQIVPRLLERLQDLEKAYEITAKNLMNIQLGRG